MFGRSRPVVFDPYPGRRSRRRVPAWLVTALVGIAIGAGGVLYIQESYLPKRLSPEQSARLQGSLDRTEAERARLDRELAEATKRLQADTAASTKMSNELAAARAALAEQRSDIRSLVEALPPDPRGGAIAVRAARFEREGGDFVYQVILTRDKSGGKPFTGTMQFVVAGARGGAPANVTLKPVEVSFDDYDSLRGRIALPEGFEPQQATVNVLDRAGGRLQGMRVLYVK